MDCRSLTGTFPEKISNVTPYLFNPSIIGVIPNLYQLVKIIDFPVLRIGIEASILLE